jgi:hypothetical protein
MPCAILLKTTPSPTTMASTTIKSGLLFRFITVFWFELSGFLSAVIEKRHGRPAVVSDPFSHLFSQCFKKT